MQKALRMVLPVLLIGGGLWTLLFAAFYLSHTYESNASLYLRLNGYCFYRSAFWPSDFFTQATKAAGNRHCIAAIGLVLAIAVYGWVKLRRSAKSPVKSPAFFTDRRNAAIIALLMLAALALWIWGNGMVAPAYDEVFSAVNCAGLHPLGTLSYYMLPNNHVLFNVLNRLLFFWADNKLMSGRILAGCAYVATVPVMYRLLLKFTERKWVAAAIALLLILHFPVWGFGFQGRGYALYTFFGWCAMAAYYRHCTQPSMQPLRILTVCVVAGYATVPTFLYLHLALLSFEGLRQMSARKFGSRFWIHTAIAFAGAYLFYVPAIAFSGAGHLLGAATPSTAPFSYVSGMVTEFVREGFQHCFSYETDDYNPVVYVLAALPAALLFFRGRRGRLKRATGLFYILLWASFIAYALWIRRWPFLRNMALHHSITLAAVLLTCWWYAEALATRIKQLRARLIILPVLLVFAVHLFRFNARNASRSLYFYDINPLYKTLSEGLTSLPAGSTIGLSEEGFYWEHLALLHHYNVVKCPSGTEDYYIMQQDELRPAFLGAAYQQADTVWQYLIFRRKNGRLNLQ